MEATVIYPKQLIVEPTNRCNLKCKLCPSVCNDGRFPVGDMSLDMFKQIANRASVEMPDVTVIPWMNGEPFLHPEYEEMIRHLSMLKLRHYITTNMTIFNESALRHILSDESTCYQLIVSLDGIEETGNIAKARPGSNQDLILGNLGALLNLAFEMKSRKHIAVKICERGQDWGEIEAFILKWIDDPQIEYVCVGKPLATINEVSMRHYPCQYFDHNFEIIRWNGAMPICAYNDAVANGGELNYATYKPGDSLLEHYNNHIITALRLAQNNSEFFGPCKTCGFAYTGYGADGKIVMRNDDLQRQLYYRFDYYNRMFSRSNFGKGKDYYLG
jgi:organic radical activating enzyme